MKAVQLSWTFLFLTLGIAAAQPSSGAKQDPLGIETQQPSSSSTTNAFRNRQLDLQPVLDLQLLSSNAIHTSPKRLTAQEFLDAPDISQPVSSNALPDFGIDTDAKLPNFGVSNPDLPDFGPTQPDLTPAPPGSLFRFSEEMVSTPQNIKRVRTLDGLVKANAESQRRYEQVIAQQQQQRALEDIAWQLQLLRRQQENEATLRFWQEDEAMQQRISSLPVLPLSVEVSDTAQQSGRRASLPVLPISVSPPAVVSANSYDPNSLANPYGAGSPYKADGLMNPYSQYGSPYSSKSWRNPYATDAPKLYDSQGNYAGKLSSNPYDPDSTANPYGRYGSPYSSQSINNPYGLGSPYNTTPIYVVPSP